MNNFYEVLAQEFFRKQGETVHFDYINSDIAGKFIEKLHAEPDTYVLDGIISPLEVPRVLFNIQDKLDYMARGELALHKFFDAKKYYDINGRIDRQDAAITEMKAFSEWLPKVYGKGE